MLEKFLISIGLKQPSSLEPYIDDSTTTVSLPQKIDSLMKMNIQET